MYNVGLQVRTTVLETVMIPLHYGRNCYPPGTRTPIQRTKTACTAIRREGNFEVPIRFELMNNAFAEHPLKPLGYRTIWVTDGNRTHDLLNHNQTL